MMQNRYVGDAGDFGKLGLLRQLSRVGEGEPTLRLGVHWYLVPDEDHNANGRHIEYLEQAPRNERIKACDPELYDALHLLVKRGSRTVSALSRSGLLPTDTVYFEDVLSMNFLPSGTPAAIDFRREYRNAWMNAAAKALVDCELIFVDPDNGFETASLPHRNDGNKYAYFDELRAFVQADKSLVVYQHVNRSDTCNEQSKRRLSQIREKLKFDGSIRVLRYSHMSCQLYFILCAEAHREIIATRIERMMQNPHWARLFDVLE
jgi:hypothetical protein